MLNKQDDLASFHAIDTTKFPQRIFLVTQAENANEIRNTLLRSAITNGWIGMG